MIKEEAIEMLNDCPAKHHCYDGKVGHCNGCNERIALDMAIKALEQEPILDRIRAEIDSAEMPKNRMSFFRDGINTALDIIDKYRAEADKENQ